MEITGKGGNIFPGVSIREEESSWAQSALVDEGRKEKKKIGANPTPSGRCHQESRRTVFSIRLAVPSYGSPGLSHSIEQ